jgi:glycosyltransferase involved in cell wall biosynthesis
LNLKIKLFIDSNFTDERVHQMNETKEILIATEIMTNTGAERVLAELANEWAKDGCKITVVQTKAGLHETCYNLSDKISFINHKSTNNRILNLFKTSFFMIKTLNQHKNARVVVFINSVMRVILFSSLFIRNRLIVSERNNPYNSPPSASRRFLRNMLFKIADRCVFQTPGAMEYFPLSVRKKGVIIPNPINPDLPVINRGERAKRILSACRLDAQKNIPMMIFAFKKLLQFYPEYELYIYGRGPLEDEIRKLIEQEKLGNKVYLPGFTDNIYEEMNKSAMFVLSSNYEGISNSMLEALGMGLPSVVTDCPAGGARMMIDNNVNGILVPVGDVQAMFEGMKKILDDEGFAKKLSANAIQIRNKYPVEKVARMWLEAI